MNYNIIESHNYKQYMQEFQIHTLLAKVLDSQQLTFDQVKDYLNPKLTYHDFSLFSDGDMVLDRIHEAIDNDEKICIYGDYDCDGILATSILVQAFSMLGKDVGYHIPNRFEDGYGLNVERVKQMHEKGYQLIITVDNGIKAQEAIDYASEVGIDVIVSDHHDFDEVPDAMAIIHTKLSPEYPFKEICGGFIAYKLASALLKRHDKYLFSLAAITTISDMMPLRDENRSLVKRGLQFMQEEKYLQLELLLGENKDYSVTSIGFQIAPKINSFGRLPEMIHPNCLVKYFMKDVDRQYAIKISEAAKTINSKRQDLTNKQYKTIIQNVSAPTFLYVHDQEVHEGIVGLVAGKYTREFHQPSFVMTYDKVHDCYRGSARSVEGLPLNELLNTLKDDLLTYGGHALAGGFSVSRDNLDKFHQDIQSYIDSHPYSKESEEKVLKVDLEDIDLVSVKELEMLEPLGQGNSCYSFMIDDAPVASSRLLSQGKHLRMDIDLPRCQVQALYFSCPTIEQLKDQKHVQIVGQLKINSFLNKESVNIIVEAMK